MESQLEERIAMGLTKQEKAERINRRYDLIVKLVSKPGGITGNQLAKRLGTTRGMVLKDIANLRRMGHPIQISSRVEEEGMLVAVYEIPKYPIRQNTYAASAGQPSQSANTGDLPAGKQGRRFAQNAVGYANTTRRGQGYGAAASRPARSSEPRR